MTNGTYGQQNRQATMTRREQSTRCAHAFTLVELLISISIIALLVGILLPAIGATMRSARGFKCQAALRSVAFDFAVFADPTMHADRGDDNRLDPRFNLTTFIESEYRIDEFWAWNADLIQSLPDAAGADPLRCPEVHGDLQVRRYSPCTASGAVGPPQHVSYGFNRRLYRAEIEGPGGVPMARSVTIHPDVLSHANVPLAWDVDGAASFAGGANPLFSAPSLGSTGPYGNDRFWFPAYRHNGAMNVAFVGGHVLTTRAATEESSWRWDYQPRVY